MYTGSMYIQYPKLLHSEKSDPCIEYLNFQVRPGVLEVLSDEQTRVVHTHIYSTYSGGSNSVLKFTYL